MDKNYREGFHEVGNTVEVANVPNVESRHHFLDSAERMVQTLVADLIRDVLKDFVNRLPEVVDRQLRLVRDEARAELKEGARKVIHAAGPLGVGVAFGFLALGFLLVAAACALALVMPGVGSDTPCGRVNQCRGFDPDQRGKTTFSRNAPQHRPDDSQPRAKCKGGRHPNRADTLGGSRHAKILCHGHCHRTWPSGHGTALVAVLRRCVKLQVSQTEAMGDPPRSP